MGITIFFYNHFFFVCYRCLFLLFLYLPLFSLHVFFSPRGSVVFNFTPYVFLCINKLYIVQLWMPRTGEHSGHFVSLFNVIYKAKSLISFTAVIVLVSLQRNKPINFQLSNGFLMCILQFLGYCYHIYIFKMNGIRNCVVNHLVGGNAFANCTTGRGKIWNLIKSKNIYRRSYCALDGTMKRHNYSHRHTKWISIPYGCMI